MEYTQTQIRTLAYRFRPGKSMVLSLLFMGGAVFSWGSTAVHAQANQCPPEQSVNVQGTRSSGGVGQYCDYGSAQDDCAAIGQGWYLESCQPAVIPDLGAPGCYAPCRCLGPLGPQCSCPNGATNPPSCDQCPAGQVMIGGQCTTPPTPTPPVTSCGDPWDMDLDGFLSAWDYGTDGGFSRTFSIDPVTKKAVARITNNTCRSVTLSLSAYKMFDTQLSTQVFYSGSGNVTIGGYGTATLQVDVPSCMAQVDLWFGLHPFRLEESNPYWTPGYVPHFLDVRYYQNNGTSYSNASGNFCSNATPTPTPTPNPYGVCKDTNADGKYDQCSACQGAACTGPTCLIANGAADCQGCNNNGICEPERGEDTTTCPNDCKPLRCGDSDGDNVYDSCKIGNTGPVCNSLADCFLQAKCVNFQCVSGAVNGAPSCLTSDTKGVFNPTCGCPAGQHAERGQACVCDNGANNPSQGCDECPPGQTMVGGKCVPKGYCADANQDGIYDQCDPKATQGVACTTTTVQADCIDAVHACRNRACTPGGTGSQYCRNTVDCVCNHDGKCDVSVGEDPTTCSSDCGYCADGQDTDDLYDLCSATGTGNNYCSTKGTNPDSECLGCDNDGICEAERGENPVTCPNDCKCPAGTSPDPVTKLCTCDNGATNPTSGCNQCPTGYSLVNGQCVPDCGNGRCEVGKGENPTTCAKDCGYCGAPNPGALYNQCTVNGNSNNFCSLGQSFSTTECLGCDNDGICEAERGENPVTCPNDCKCPAGTSPDPVTKLCTCDNGATNPTSGCNQCPTGYSLVNGQCKPDCGNGICEVNKGENPTTCAKDCGYCGAPNPGALYNQCTVNGNSNNFCSLGQSFSTTECLGCDNDGICEAERGENPVTCPNDCKCPAGTSPDPVTKLCTCDNGATNPTSGCNQCPTGYSLVNGQCKPDCGNGICEVNKGENPTTCAKDCGYCGAPNPGALYNQCTVNGNSNNFCSLGQSFSTAECLGCDNDGICEAERGENPVTCPNDCKCGPGQTVCASTGQCVNSTCGGFGVYNPAICACQCPAGMLPGPNGSCQCPPNSVRSGGSCIVCRPGTHPDASQTVCVGDGKECLACGCVEKVAEGLDNQPIDIVGNGQTFKYRIIIENRSLETDTAVAEYDFNVFDYINAKQTFTRDIVGNQEDPFSGEGYLTFDPASVRVEANRNCDGSQADVNLGGFAPGRNIGSVIIPSVNKTNSSTVGYPPIHISNLKSINNPACGGSGDWSHVEITYQATAHTNQPGHELKNHGFVQVTNEVLTCNDVKCVNDDQADIIVSRSAIASSNAGTTFFGAGTGRGAAVNLSSLQALYESISKTSTGGAPVSNFAGVLLSSVTDLFSSYLRSVLFADTQNYDQAIDSSTNGVLRGVASGTTTTPNVTVSSETDLPALLMRRADDASIYQATDGLTVNMASPAASGNSFDHLSTVIVKKGNLVINSNITTGPNGNIAFVVQEGNIVIAPNVTRIDAILVVQNKDYGIIGNGVRSNVPLVINGSVYGNFESKNPKRLLTEDRVIVGAPGVVPNAVTVNYSAKILTLLPPGLKSILTAAQFGQVVGSGG